MFQLSGVDSWLMNPQGEKMNVLLRGTSGRSCAVDVAGRAVTIRAPTATPIASVLDTDPLRVVGPPRSERAPVAPILILGLLPCSCGGLTWPPPRCNPFRT